MNVTVFAVTGGCVSAVVTVVSVVAAVVVTVGVSVSTLSIAGTASVSDTFVQEHKTNTEAMIDKSFFISNSPYV